MGIIVYRVCRAKFADDLSGEGARLFGGRWNHKLSPCIYTAESRALAILEYTVNVNIDEIPRALCMATLEIPDEMTTWAMAQLPGNWKDAPAPNSTKSMGTQWLKRGKTAVLKIPSVIIPDEFNFILNPVHPDAKRIKILDTKDLPFDIRIKQD